MKLYRLETYGIISDSQGPQYTFSTLSALDETLPRSLSYFPIFFIKTNTSNHQGSQGTHTHPFLGQTDLISNYRTSQILRMQAIHYRERERHKGASNLPKIITQQCQNQKLNLWPPDCMYNALPTEGSTDHR